MGKKDLLLPANKLIEKIPGPCNAKEHYLSFIRKKNTKLVITENVKTSNKLSKTEKVGSNSSLYSDTKKINFFKRTECKNSETRTCI